MQLSFPQNYKDSPSIFSKIRYPLRFQGWNKTKTYFEGWYYKVVDVEKNIAFALIPGISIIDKNDQHAFIQVMDGINCTSEYHKFDIQEFSASIDSHYIKIGSNVFSEEQMIVDLPTLRCNLTSTKWSKLPFKLSRPGIMGWYSYIPTMQCNHGLGSMLHYWDGEIAIKNQKQQLNKAVGYVEKDWGMSFPQSWIWSQCNTFDIKEEFSVFASVAHIPWKGTHFIGFLAAVYYKGEVDIFSTYTSAKRLTSMTENAVLLSFQKRNKSLKLNINKAPGADLISPLSGEMRGKVNESIQAKMHVEYNNGIETVIANGTHAGLEVAGPVKELMV